MGSLHREELSTESMHLVLGFSQFYFNCAGNLARETRAAFDEIGLRVRVQRI